MQPVYVLPSDFGWASRVCGRGQKLEGTIDEGRWWADGGSPMARLRVSTFSVDTSRVSSQVPRVCEDSHKNRGFSFMAF
jgi:hypothetical protein